MPRMNNKLNLNLILIIVAVVVVLVNGVLIGRYVMSRGGGFGSESFLELIPPQRIFSGTVESVSGDSIVLVVSSYAKEEPIEGDSVTPPESELTAQVTVRVGQETTFAAVGGTTGQPVTLQSLEPGDMITVATEEDLRFHTNRTVTAVRIDYIPAVYSISGPVTALSQSSITVDGLISASAGFNSQSEPGNSPIAIDQSTSVQRVVRAAPGEIPEFATGQSVSQISTGDVVTIQLQKAENGYRAKEITILPDPGSAAPQGSPTGSVSPTVPVASAAAN